MDIFKTGLIRNPIKGDIARPLTEAIYGSVIVDVPARINAMCFDLDTLAEPVAKSQGIYTAGELALSADVATKANIKVYKNDRIKIASGNKRKSIIRHSALLMKKAIGFTEGLYIDARNVHDYPHCGLGSSAALQVAVAAGINKLYGSPISRAQLLKYLTQNYGEEINGDDKRLVQIQSIGGGAATALYGGGMVAIAGESVVINRSRIPKKFSFVFGIPSSYKKYDAKTMIEKEEAIFPKMKRASRSHAYEISWYVLHRLLPAMKDGDLMRLGDIIHKVKFEFGSLENDRHLWPDMYDILIQLARDRKKENIEILSYSCSGPLIYALTTKPESAQNMFEEFDLDTFLSAADNKGARFHTKR